MIKLFGFKTNIPTYSDWGIDNNLKKSLSIKVLREIYSEGVKRSDSISDDLESLKSKSYTLLSIFISLLGLMIALFFDDNLTLNFLEEKATIFLYGINIFIISYSIIQLIIIISPNLLKLKGEEPMDMDYKAMSSLNEEEQELTYLFNSIEGVQDKISYNEYLIKSMTQRFESVLFISSSLFIVTLIIIFIVTKI